MKARGTLPWDRGLRRGGWYSKEIFSPLSKICYGWTHQILAKLDQQNLLLPINHQAPGPEMSLQIKEWLLGEICPGRPKP